MGYKIAFVIFCIASLVRMYGKSETEELNYSPYVYQSTVVSIYDADTITVDVDLGFNVVTRQKIRLNRINAWEVRGEEKTEGIIARDYLRSRIPVGSIVYLKTVKDKQGKYGRYLADVYTKSRSECLNDTLVNLNHAKYQRY